MNSTMQIMECSNPYQVPIPVNSTEFNGSSAPTVSGFLFGDVFAYLWSLVTLWRLFVLLLLCGNAKNIPFIWHLRIVNAFRFCCKTQRPKVPITSAHLFQPLITTSHTPLMEIDFNIHKTNSSYFSDLDIARTHLVCTLFTKGLEHFRGGTSAYNGPNIPLMGLALGAVSCSFKKELKPYESYELWTRILTWDEKWIYIVTHFVRKGVVAPKEYTLYPQQDSKHDGRSRNSSISSENMESHPGVVATALSKCVFKQGRRTVSPALMFMKSGLLPTKSLDDVLPAEIEPVTMQSCSSSDSGIDVGESKEESELERVEKERQRGMRIAVTLAAQSQNALEMEFTAEEPALGRHRDGTGITGVVSCLAQLAHLKKSQVL